MAMFEIVDMLESCEVRKYHTYDTFNSTSEPAFFNELYEWASSHYDYDLTNEDWLGINLDEEIDKAYEEYSGSPL